MDAFSQSPKTPTKLHSNRKRSLNVGQSHSNHLHLSISSPGVSPMKGKGSHSPPPPLSLTPPRPGTGTGDGQAKSPYSPFSPSSKAAAFSSLSSPDRYIPSRSTLDLDYCNYELMKRVNDENQGCGGGDDVAKDGSKSNPNHNNKHNSELSFALANRSPGKKRLMDCFERKQHSPYREEVSSLRSSLDSTTQEVNSPVKDKNFRALPSGPSRVLDAPDLVDDYYLNLLSWGRNNVIAVALQHSVYLWHAADGKIDELCRLDGPDDYITSLEWSTTSDNSLAIGTSSSEIQLWDAGAMCKVRSMQGHTARVSSLSWNQNMLTSGGRDSVILNHDIRASRNVQSCFVGHQQEVCGLSWSPDGKILASGGNENLLCLWDMSSTNRMSSSTSSSEHFSPLYSLDHHQAAVKALAWCPWQRNVLASGGGTADRTIRIWNVANGSNLKTVDSGSQVCALQWSEAHKELLSSHGFSDNQLCLWKFPTMTKIKEFRGHTSRVLHMAKSPDGCTVVSAGADETLRFWDMFGPSTMSKKSSLLSPTSLPLRTGMMTLR